MPNMSLTQGKIALVDDEDYERLKQFKWRAVFSYNTWYAKTGNNIYMHRIVMNTPTGLETDHINGDGLDNRKSNLRVVTRHINSQNQHREKTSAFVGVSWAKRQKRWKAQINIGKVKHLGYFESEKEAYRAYCEAVI